MSDFLQKITIVFIIWEIARLFISKISWENVVTAWSKKEENKLIKGKYPVLNFIGYIYMIYLILLLFTQWWWVSLAMIALAILTTISMFPAIKREAKFSFQIFLMYAVDTIITVLLLMEINNPMTLLNV